MKTERLFAIGRILKPHGIKGDAKVEILTDDPEYFFEVDEVQLTDKPDNPAAITAKIKDVRLHKGAVLLKLDIIATPEDVEKYRGFYIMLPESVMHPLEEDEYFVSDLEGMKVITEDGQEIGEVVKIIPGGFHDIYEIKNTLTGRMNMIPAVKEFIKSVNLENRTITIKTIEGLIEE